MGSEKRVLIVDDEHNIADTLKTIFSNAGYSAQAAYSAEQALPLIAEWNPQLVIVDVRLPGMNGVDLAMKMKAEFPLSSTLLFTGDGSVAELVELARRKGHNFELLAKPVPPGELLTLAADFFPSPKAIVPGNA
ncbi:MAG TPA: response regulator [Acidobacteriaceae bacterium]|jgi:DNA-binding NtrC family response regulator|nr:response regulator [Acidobacteriaceae bacterium]